MRGRKRPLSKSNAMNEYPKSLYRKGWEDLNDTIVVHDPGEEAAARLDGFRMLSEPEPEKAAARQAKK